MLQNEIAATHPGSGSTYANPARLPQGGGWGSWISGYGSSDWFEFTAQANRTASISVLALDENGAPTEGKLLPVIGIWELSDESQNPAPAATPSAFNTTIFGMTRLDAQFGASETYRLGVADFRGDGRPDYFYQASILYSDKVTPARLSMAGGIATLNGIGFNPGQKVTVCSSILPEGSCVGGHNGSTLSTSASQIEVVVPAGLQDGIVSVQVTDSANGAFSQMIDALTYGALSTDLLLLLQGVEPATPVGSQAANPIRVRAVAADGITPVSGATLAWSATNGLQFSVCNEASSCSVLSDEAGESSSWATPTATGQSTITVALAPASYSSPHLQQATLVGTSSTLDLVAVSPTRWVGQGAAIAVPLTVEALDLGVPMANVTVNFAIAKGTASLSSGSGTTNGLGFTTITATLANQSTNVQVTACVAPNNNPCQTFTLFSTPASSWALETVSGSSQIVVSGQSFQPLVMRVTDGSSAANPVMGVNVTFSTTLARVSSALVGPIGVGSGVERDGTPVLLGSSQAQMASDQNGLASILPSASNVGPCDVFIAVTAGPSMAQFQMESLAAIVPEQPITGPTNVPTPRPVPRFVSSIGPQAFAPQSEMGMLYVFSMDVPNNEPQPDSAVDASPELSVESAASDQGDSTSPAPAESKHSVSPPDANSKPAKAATPKNVAQIKSDVAVTNVPKPVETQPKPASSSRSTRDKRSCRELAGDNSLP